MPGFFLDHLEGERALIREDAGHIVKTLRRGEGGRVFAFDGLGNRLECEIVRADRREVDLRVLSAVPAGTEPRVSVTLYQGLTKAPRMELVIQKCVELGIGAIVPVVFSRCEVRDLGAERLGRYRKIAREAAKQCGRAVIPRIGEAIPFSELLQARECLICPYEEAEGYGLYRGLLDRAGRGRYGIVVGPEGGMTREEAHSLREAGGGIVTLGPRILRTETAGMAVLSAMLCVYGEME